VYLFRGAEGSTTGAACIGRTGILAYFLAWHGVVEVAVWLLVGGITLSVHFGGGIYRVTIYILLAFF